jgi:hypothetical protein
MHFQIDTLPAMQPSGEDAFEWRLVAATGDMARSPAHYGSVALARNSIAQFKRSASGVRYARVQEPQDA